MSAQIDCPICMDVIEVNKNCVTTECGHCFHSNCLMKSVAHNGFGCPYCRTVMAEFPEDDEETVYTDASDDEENELYNDDALRGLRFFYNNLLSIEHDDDDIREEDDYESEIQELELVEEEESKPSNQFVSDKLREQGISYEQLVSLLLNRDHDEYSCDRIERFDQEVFGKIRRIVSNYTPEQETLEQVAIPQLAQPLIVSEPVQRPNEVTPQPKVRRIITHV